MPCGTTSTALNTINACYLNFSHWAVSRCWCYDLQNKEDYMKQGTLLRQTLQVCLDYLTNENELYHDVSMNVMEEK